MPRPARIEFPGAIYHVTARGNHQAPIFLTDGDRLAFLAIVGESLHAMDAAMLAYCLMDNHYHFVLQTHRANLSRLMQRVNGQYTHAANSRHGRTGHLFQGRFHATLVDEDAYLVTVCRYVERNPVRASIVTAAAADWTWSSYRAHIGLRAGPDWLDSATLHGHLIGRDAKTAADRRLAARLYAQLVNEASDWTPGPHLRREVFLGDEAFVARVQARLDDLCSEPD